jgi:hypothetical protein
MEHTAPITPKDLDKIKVHDSEGKLAACLAIGVTMYIEDPHARSVREQIAECIEQYLALTRPHLRWFVIGDKKIKDMRLCSPSPVVGVVDQLEEDDTFQTVLTGAEDFEQASPYNLAALLKFKTNFYQLGFITACVAFKFIEQQPPGFFTEMVLQWCQRLKPLHGYAGIYIALSAEQGTAIRNEPIVYPLVKRFPGIEFDAPTITSQHFKKGIKGVNWLTVLSDKFVAELGGIETLKDGLGDACPLYTYPGGAVIQAGPYPQLGDLEQGIKLKDYQKVYRQVKPVQADYKYGYLRTPKDVDGKAFAQQWLHRFE